MRHHQEGGGELTDGSGEGAGEGVTVRLKLPNDFTLIRSFLPTVVIAEILLSWEQEIKEQEGQEGRQEGQEVVMKCGDLGLRMEQFDTTVWQLGGRPGSDLNLEYLYDDIEEELSKTDAYIKEVETRLIEDEVVKAAATTLEQTVENLNQDRPWTERPIVDEMILALKREDSPFRSRQFPPNINKNNYCDIILFSRLNMPKIYRLLLSLYSTDHQFTSSDIFPLAQVLSELAAMINNKNTAMRKVRTLLLKSSGLTNDGLASMAKSGLSVGAKTWQSMRSTLAAVADGLLARAAKISLPMISFDNLNYTIRHLRQDFTQPIWLFKKVDIEELPKNDHKSLEQKIEMFEPDTFLLTSPQNSVYLQQFKNVMYTCLAQLMVDNFPGNSVLKKLFPKHHDHPNKATSTDPTTAHMEKPLYIPESNTLDMVSILIYLQVRFSSDHNQHCILCLSISLTQSLHDCMVWLLFAIGYILLFQRWKRLTK